MEPAQHDRERIMQGVEAGTGERKGRNIMASDAANDGGVGETRERRIRRRVATVATTVAGESSEELIKREESE
ncbi:hypothetical protein PV326_004571 [Microctonus aethiopoides]|nr:hypothetical protein PV326_004571 [Microctonus aethiopoides]